MREELARVVAADAEGRLGQVVRPEGEELGLRGDLAGGQRGARQLDHRADDVVVALPKPVALADGAHLGGKSASSRLEVDQRDHDLGVHGLLEPLLGHVAGGLEDRARLHARDLGVRDAEAAAAVAEHRVRFVQHRDPALDLRRLHAQHLGDLGDPARVVREELVQRRIQGPDGHRVRRHRHEDALEVLALEREQLGERLLALDRRLREDHLAEEVDLVALEEHVLGAAQADALRAKSDGVDTPAS